MSSANIQILSIGVYPHCQKNDDSFKKRGVQNLVLAIKADILKQKEEKITTFSE